jgi:hypothetical protein
MSGSASASGDRTVNFSVNGPGMLTVTVPYTISLTGDTSDCYYCYNYDHASVSGSANFYSDASHGSSSSNSNASFSLDNYYWHPSPQSGTLVFGIFASGAGNGSLQVNFDLSAQGASSARTRILCDAAGWIRADGRSHKTPEREQKRLNYYPSHESLLLPNKSR